MRRAAKTDAKSREFGIWACAECGKEKRATVHQMRKTYCSMECMAAGYKKRMGGEANPNYRGASQRICECCGEAFDSYVKTAKYCSQKCYHQQRASQQKKCNQCGSIYRSKKNQGRRTGTGGNFCSWACYQKSLPKQENRQKSLALLVRNFEKCENCGTSFQAMACDQRKFCSYECFVESGGPQRAGEAAVRAMKKYGAKKDANHNELFKIIRQVVPAHDLSDCGFGVPDGLAWIKGAWHLFDIKNPETSYGRKGLNEKQKEWAFSWRGGPVFLIYNQDDAENFVRGEFDKVKRFPKERMSINELSPER